MTSVSINVKHRWLCGGGPQIKFCLGPPKGLGWHWTGPLHLQIYMQKLNKRVCFKRGKKYMLLSYREHNVPMSLQLGLVVCGTKSYVWLNQDGVIFRDTNTAKIPVSIFLKMNSFNPCFFLTLPLLSPCVWSGRPQCCACRWQNLFFLSFKCLLFFASYCINTSVRRGGDPLLATDCTCTFDKVDKIQKWPG